MELGLSLGDASSTVGFLKETKSTGLHQNSSKMAGLNFCMGLGLGSPAAGNQGPNGGGGDDDEASQGDDESDGDNQAKNPVLQLNLLPLVPVNPRRPISSHLIHSLPWSSDNGSSDNGSSGNIGPEASPRGLDVNKPPVGSAADEVSSANSVGSLFTHMDVDAYSNGRGINGNLPLLGGGGSSKRSLELEPAAGNDPSEAERASSRASDDDESGPHARKKLRLSKQQSAFLEETFKEHSTLNPKQKLALAKQLNLRPRQVEVWFQNRRARTKLKQTEVDCEYLKRCCETLTEENRRLHKELQELRALKTSNPFHLQLPATTLTMCPSCERVAAAPPPPPKTAAAPFPLARPRFHPFSSNPAHHANNNQPAAS